MYFSRIRLDPQGDAAVLAGQLVGASDYRQHRLLWNLFPEDPEAPRDFLFRRDQSQGRLQYFLLSQRLPQAGDTPWLIESKSYRPKLSPGQALQFSLRANPVISRKGGNGCSKRHDIVMDAKTRIGWVALPTAERQPLAQLVQEAGEQWLRTRLEHRGAELVQVRADGYLSHQWRKRNNGKTVSYSTLEFEGSLRVTDPERFQQALLAGIGPAKAFGCGLLLVRRI